LFCPLDILLLRGFISAAQKQEDDLSGLLEVNAVTRSIGNSHFADACSDRLDITAVAKAQALNAGNNFRHGFLIRKTRQPFVEFVGLLNLEHVCIL
jgi:hypothetical protein